MRLPSAPIAAKSLDRRQVIAGAGLAFLSCLHPKFAEALERSKATFASAYRNPQGGFGIAVLEQNGHVLWQHKLEQRGHGLTSHQPSGRLVMFARRPGLFALAFEGASSFSEPAIIFSPAGRHFYGHGTFSHDGKILYASENDFETSRGLIGLYDVSDGYARLGEFASGGIGPHELALTKDGRHLVVANGGIETHPDFGRAKLNIATMAPSLTVIDARHGDITETHRLPASQHQLSLRHLAVGADDRIWYGGQWEGQAGGELGDMTGTSSLIGCLKIGEGLASLSADPAKLSGLKSYVGSVALSADGSVGAATSPRGGEVIFWDTEIGKLVGKQTMVDVCGVAPSVEGTLALSAGSGALRLAGEIADTTTSFRWDNHLLRL